MQLGGKTLEWRNTYVGTNRRKVTYKPEGWRDALWWWRPWVEQQQLAGVVPSGTTSLLEEFQFAVDTYASIVIDGIRLWTAVAAEQRGRGCHWIVCPAQLLPQGLAGAPGQAPRPVFGRIKGILVHQHSALPDAIPDPRLHGMALLLVEWYVAPLSHRRTNYYHPRMLAPVVGARRGGAAELPITAVPASEVTPLELVVRTDPRNAAVQVVLPANNDLYFMTAFGYEGPRV